MIWCTLLIFEPFFSFFNSLQFFVGFVWKWWNRLKPGTCKAKKAFGSNKDGLYHLYAFFLSSSIFEFGQIVHYFVLGFSDWFCFAVDVSQLVVTVFMFSVWDLNLFSILMCDYFASRSIITLVYKRIPFDNCQYIVIFHWLVYWESYLKHPIGILYLHVFAKKSENLSTGQKI